MGITLWGVAPTSLSTGSLAGRSLLPRSELAARWLAAAERRPPAPIRGYSIDEQEQELGVRCFAMSVPGAPSPLAISVSGPISRVDDDFAARAIPLLRSVAEQIAADMQPGA